MCFSIIHCYLPEKKIETEKWPKAADFPLFTFDFFLS